MNPFLLSLNKDRERFYLNIFFKNSSVNNKIYFIHQKNSSSLKNFYLKDILSKNSKIMAECHLFYTKLSNFN